MLKKNIFLYLIAISLIGNFLYTFKSKINIDSVFDKLVSCNRHQYDDREFSAWNFNKEIVHINEFIEKTELKNPRNFLTETGFFISNLDKLSNHGPIFNTLTRLPIIRSLGIWGFRLLNFAFFILALFILNALMKQLLFSDDARYLTLLFSTLSIHGRTIIQHGRIYASGLVFNILVGFLLIKLLKSTKRKKLYAFLLLISIHICFLNYFFYAAYLPVIFCGFLTYAYLHHQELNIEKRQIYYLILYLFFCLASLFIHKDMAINSINQSVDGWISNNGHFDFNYYAKNIIDNYFNLLGNHLKQPWNLILTIYLITSGLFSKNIKKIIPFYIIFFGISLSLFMLDCYFQTRTSYMIRYTYASLPAVFMIYGLSFSNLGKTNFIVVTLFFLAPILFPQSISRKTLHYIQMDAIKLAESTSQTNIKKENTLIISYMLEIDTLTFCKYLVEDLDDQPAIFNQKTQRKIFITTKPITKIEELSDFIKEKNIRLVILLDHRLIWQGDKKSEINHQLKSKYLSVLQNELPKLNDIEIMVVKNLVKSHLT